MTTLYSLILLQSFDTKSHISVSRLERNQRTAEIKYD